MIIFIKLIEKKKECQTFSRNTSKVCEAYRIKRNNNCQII